jgi:phage gpG-like protein
MSMSVTITRKCREIDIDPAELNRKIGLRMVSSTQRKIKGNIAPANAPLTVAVKRGSKTLRDRGQLLASITYRSDTSQAVVGTNHIGAKLQQFGGTIKPKKGRYLWIPASARIRTLQRKYGFDATSVLKGIKADGYTYWLTEKSVRAKKGKKGKPFTVFILKKAVTIPARPFLYVDDLDHRIIENLMKSMVRRKQ